MTERELVSALASYMQREYPAIVYRFDLAADLKLTPGQAMRHKRLHPHRGYPDMFVAAPKQGYPGGDYIAFGLFLELKREGTRLKKRNGRWANSHIEEQASVLEELTEQGYVAQFAVGLDEAKRLITEHLVPWEEKSAVIADDLPF